MNKPYRDDDGRLPTYAWPGGYPLFYLTQNDGILCPSCANTDNGSDAVLLDAVEIAARTLRGVYDPNGDDIDDHWRIVAVDINYETDDLHCDHCGREIECAYPSHRRPP